MLATIIQNSETESPQLARRPTINLANHVRQLEAVESGTSIIQNLLEQIHNEAFTDYEQRPQWKVYIVPILAPNAATKTTRFHLAFASSHALVDGSSGLYFHTSFLEALNHMSSLSYGDESLLDTSTGVEVLAPVEQDGKLTISWSFLLKPLLSEFLPPWLSGYLGLGSEASSTESPIWCGSQKRPDRSTQGQLIQTASEVFSVPSNILRSTLAVCKSHNARLTGLLNHLVARSLARALRSRDQKYSRFAVDTAIDLRKCIPEAQARMGSYASGSPETLTISDINSPVDWTAISNSTQTLQQASSTLADQPLGLLRYLSKIRDWVNKKAETPAGGSFGTSNVGTFSGQRQSDSAWSIDEMVFSQSADATGLPLNVNVASAKGGSLNVVLTWWPGMLGVQDERQLVREICRHLERQLNEICGQ